MKAEIIAPGHGAENYRNTGLLGCQVVALGVSKVPVTCLHLHIQRWRQQTGPRRWYESYQLLVTSLLCQTNPSWAMLYRLCHRHNSESCYTVCATGSHREPCYTAFATGPFCEPCYTVCATGPRCEPYTVCVTGPHPEPCYTVCATGPLCEPCYTAFATGPLCEPCYTVCATGLHPESRHVVFVFLWFSHLQEQQQHGSVHAHPEDKGS